MHTTARFVAYQALICSLLSFFSSQVQADTLAQVASQVLKSHPRLRAAASTARSVQYEIKQAEAGNSPKFGLIADPGRSYNRATKEWNSAGDFGVRGTYLLYDGGRTDNEIERQRAQFLSATERSKLTEDQLIGQVADAYIEALKQDTLAQLAKANVDAHADLYSKTQEIVKLDKGRAYDLAQAGARLQQAEVTLSSRRGALQIHPWPIPGGGDIRCAPSAGDFCLRRFQCRVNLKLIQRCGLCRRKRFGRIDRKSVV